jgi:hypothetical protein
MDRDMPVGGRKDNVRRAGADYSDVSDHAGENRHGGIARTTRLAKFSAP